MILIAGFEGKNNSSKLALDKLAFLIQNNQKVFNYPSKEIELLYLKNDKAKSAEQIVKKLEHAQYEKIILLGQKPKIKDKISVELQAKIGEKTLDTNCNMAELTAFLNKNKINYYFSKNCGTSYCNYIYFFTLDYILKTKISSPTIFIHLPYATKNKPV